MELELIGTSKAAGVSVFSVKPKTEKSYSGLEEISKDILEGLKLPAGDWRPGVILLFDGKFSERMYVRDFLRSYGYYSLEVNEPAPEDHPGEGVYIVHLDYFLNRLANPRAD